MKMLNRSALVVVPKQAYADWVNALPADVSGLEQPQSLADYCQEGRVYLISEPDQTQGGVDYISATLWQEIMENELSAWDEFGDYYPKSLNQEIFDQWFDVSFQVLVFDLAKDALMVASLDGG